MEEENNVWLRIIFKLQDIDSLHNEGGLPAEVRASIIPFNECTDEKVALQLKLLPKGTYAQTIAKASEVILIRYSSV